MAPLLVNRPTSWGCSSAGRALDWQSRGQGFKSPQLHQKNQKGSGTSGALFSFPRFTRRGPCCLASMSSRTMKRSMAGRFRQHLSGCAGASWIVSIFVADRKQQSKRMDFVSCRCSFTSIKKTGKKWSNRHISARFILKNRQSRGQRWKFFIQKKSKGKTADKLDKRDLQGKSKRYPLKQEIIEEREVP